MITAISKLRVPDYARWAAQYDAGASSRTAFGVETLAYGQDIADPGIAITVIRVENEATLRQLFDHPVLKKNLETEGIESLGFTLFRS